MKKKVYRDAKGHFVSKEIWEYLQREKKGQKEQKRAKPKKPPKKPEPEQRKKRKRRSKKYPPELVFNEQLKLKGRKRLADWKARVKGGREAGLRANKRFQVKWLATGKPDKPLITERNKLSTSYVWVFEDLEGEQHALHVLDHYKETSGARAIIAIEARARNVVERVGSWWGTPRVIIGWILGWQNRPSGRRVFDLYEGGGRLIWELEVMIPK